ncbi:hypothetical protein PV325_001331 [Microctonus aethiopoides]|uniref:Uncharacterized protein n=1 Tax=Microctonus aethiopoides TaxID=144406 RepID=A0AA39FUZ2_9HYME|nr:hypothetical protein PV325_001331 [Microctonus aethiopoides]KAK0176208.1 hypothetical protein PV328_000366 [Microctonus aethiopoides]
MDGEEFTQILQTFDFYLKLLENPSTYQHLTCDNVSKAFSCSIFVEATVTRVNEVNQTQNFENHLHGHWKKMKRIRMYTCSELQLACDNLLEVFMKSPNITTEIIDKLLHLYVQNCGRKRLNSFLDNMLPNTLSGNILINSMVELGLSNSIIEDEERIIVWENLASCGKGDEIYQAINQIINEGHVKKILYYLSELSQNSPVEDLIMKNFIQRINVYDIPICLAIIEVKRKLLRRLLKNQDFQISFMDAIFYFGRNMTRDVENNRWKSNNSFTYRHLVRIINNLLTITDQIGELTSQRLTLAKAQMDGAIWLDVEKICLESPNN